MQRAGPIRRRRPSRSFQRRDAIHAVVIYDDGLSLFTAQGALGSLSLAADPQLHIDSHIWSFARLTRLDVRHASLAFAREADLIIVAGPASEPLPDHVGSWLSECVRENRKGPPTLIGIYEEGRTPPPTPPPLRAQLQSLAALWQTPLLCNGEFRIRLGSGLVHEFAHSEDRLGSGATLQSVLSMPPNERWGINE